MSILVNEKGETYKSELIYNLPETNESTVLTKNSEDKSKMFRPEIEKSKLNELRQKSTWRGIFYLVRYFAALIFCGYMAYVTWGTYWTILWFWLYGTIYIFSGACEHECRHRTFVKQRWLNDLIQYILSFMTFRETEWMRWAHALHHSYCLQTQDPYDFELQIPRPSNLFRFYMTVIPFGQLLWIHESLFAQNIKCALGIIPFAVKECVPKHRMSKVILNSRIHLLFYCAVITASIIFQTILPVLFFLLPYFYGNTILFLVGLTQHAGLEFNVKDPRINCRSVIFNPVLSFLYCNMDYHMEHHMFPMVPWYNLPKLHEHLKSKLPVPNKGLIAAYREIIPLVHKQATDPSYVPVRKIPV